jgi:hypothetical protein
MNVIAFLLVALATPAFGQLTWENTEQTLTAKLLDKAIVAKFDSLMWELRLLKLQTWGHRAGVRLRF